MLHAGRMDFVHKNFEFRTMPLTELVGRCQSPGAFPALIASGERSVRETWKLSTRMLSVQLHIVGQHCENFAHMCIPLVEQALCAVLLHIDKAIQRRTV